jgi:4'-phosphopantetheinyl transferase
VTPRGRPYLDPRHRRSDLDFSLSHAGDFVLIAVGLGGRVGADIEFGRRHVDVAAVGRLVFTADEQQRLAGCGNDADRHDLFFRLWVRKEAVAKADGRGLAAIVQPFPVSGDAGKTVVSLADEGGIVRQWRLFDLELPPGYYGALASDLPGPPRRFAGCPEHLAARPDSSAPLRT